MKKQILPLLIIVLSLILCYGRIINNDFLYDAKQLVVRNPDIRTLKGALTLFIKKQTVYENRFNYRPLTMLSYAVNYSLSKLNPRAYQMSNLVWHIINAVLVYWLALLLGFKMPWALIASLFFGLFPPNMEVFAQVSGRSNVLFLCFYLSSFIYFIKYLNTKISGYFVCSLLLYLLSMFSKEMAITLPIILVVYCFCMRDWRTTEFKQHGRYIVLYGVIPLVYLGMKFAVLGSTTHRMGRYGINIFNLIAVLWTRYITLLFWPFCMKVQYNLDIEEKLFSPWFVIMSYAVFILTCAAVYILFKKKLKLYAFALSWIFITLLPVLNIIPIPPFLNERFLYLPAIGFCLCAAGFLSYAYRIAILRKPAALFIAGLISLFVIESQARIPRWKNEISLFSYAIEAEPNNLTNYIDLSMAYRDQYDQAMSIAVLRRAMNLNPKPEAKSMIYANIGISFAKIQKYDKALVFFNKAIDWDPINSDNYFRRGKLYYLIEEFDMAAADLKFALRLNPSNYLALNFLKEHPL